MRITDLAAHAAESTALAGWWLGQHERQGPNPPKHHDGLAGNPCGTASSNL